MERENKVQRNKLNQNVQFFRKQSQKYIYNIYI